MTILDIRKAKELKQKLTMVTAYDHWSAALIAETEIDMVLVGDSSAMVMQGHADTIPATIDGIATFVRAVHKGAPKKLIIADLPFLSFRLGLEASVRNVMQLMQAGAHAVKLEGCDGNEALISHLVESGVPVMGHIGLTPQFVNAFGGFKVQGRDKEKAQKLLDEARRLEKAGCFTLVLECIPQPLAAEITASLKIPTIGIGAGAACDGQVLVLHDLLGLTAGGFQPKFVRRYLNGAELVKGALERYVRDVRSGEFPSRDEGYE